MNSKRLWQFASRPPVILLAVGLLTYGAFIPLLNYFWDDLAIHWIADVYGTQGLARYFSTNRPVWGHFYQLNTALLGETPWAWQAFGLFWRWVAATGLYQLLKTIFAEQEEPALWGALLFMVFPGFSQQYIGMVYGHFFLVLAAFFYSLVLKFRGEGSRLLSGVSLLLCALNLFAMEYFFMLELLRPLILWLRSPASGGARTRQVLRAWLPYLAIFAAALVWRTAIFEFQTENYEASLLSSLRTQPLTALAGLFQRIGQDLWTVLILPWGNAFNLPDPATFGQRALLLVSVLSLLVLAILALARPLRSRQPQPGLAAPGKRLLLALAAFLLAGAPFWLTNLSVNLHFPFDRFTIPFTLAFVLFWVTLLHGAGTRLPAAAGRVAFILLVTFSAAHQLQTGIYFQRDWEQQARLMWQLAWRAPSIQPGTIIFAHELPLRYFSDGSLTAALNWTYDPEPASDTIRYALYFPTVRVGNSIETLLPNQLVRNNLLVGYFEGNTSQSLALVYQPPACLRILDPEVEVDNWMTPLQVRETIHLTSTARISSTPQARPPEFLYGPEPAHGWCYYYQKADLARQLGDWEGVLEIAQIAFALSERPNDPAERFPFIEAYAHAGDWGRALQLSREAGEITPLMHPVLCRLWARIERETSLSPERAQAVNRVEQDFACPSAP